MREAGGERYGTPAARRAVVGGARDGEPGQGEPQRTLSGTRLLLDGGDADEPSGEDEAVEQEEQSPPRAA